MKANTLLVVGLVAVGGFIAYKKLGMNTNVNTDPAKGSGDVRSEIDPQKASPFAKRLSQSEANNITKELCELVRKNQNGMDLRYPTGLGSRPVWDSSDEKIFKMLMRKLKDGGFELDRSGGMGTDCKALRVIKAEMAFTGRCFTGSGGLRSC